jgi:molybdopterin molybdotransferase
MRMCLTLEEAWDVLLAAGRPVEREKVSLAAALGRVLGEVVMAGEPIPRFDRSALDGYAVRALDLSKASPQLPAVLKVVEEVPAGQVATRTLRPGQAVRIMTGAPIPAGADAVVRLEATERVASGCVRVKMEVPEGEAISRAGEDAPAGAVLFQPGTRIGCPEVAVLAANGNGSVKVYRKPRVGILVSGSEVRALSGNVSLGPGQIWDSNGAMLAALVQECGGEPVSYGIVGDDLDETVETLQRMAGACDLLLTTGGVSVGDYDLMREAYVQAGGVLSFWKVAMRPGTPVTFAEIQGRPVLGLSGNPAAAWVNFHMLARPLLRKLAGLRSPRLRTVQAVLETEYASSVIGLDRFLRARLSVRDGRLVALVSPHGQKAAILTSLVGTEALVRIPARTEIEKGALVDCYLLGDSVFLS